MQHLGIFIGPGIVLLIAIIGGAVMWGWMKKSVEVNTQGIASVKQDCLTFRTDCRDEMCAKIEELKDTTQNAQKEFVSELRNIAKFTGRVEEFMNQHRGKFQ